MVDELAPPRKSVELEDPGTGYLDSSDESSDRFTDASEGRKRAPSQSSDRSPIPLTRVERLDDTPAYGEVPGTDAYAKRAQDAVPDEVEVVTRSRSASRVNPLDRPTTPGDKPVPKIVAIKIDPDEPAYGDVPGTEAYEKRRADAIPDVILKSPEDSTPPDNPFAGSPTPSSYRSPPETTPSHRDSEVDEAAGKAATGDEGLGDDFDEFEEGQDGEDFGDFDEGFQQGEVEEEGSKSSTRPHAVATSPLQIPTLDWDEFEGMEELNSALEPYIAALFPSAELANQIQAPSLPPQTFLSDRSLSLYSQLVAPPPLAPPNWLRSRIRRLFLVSLGVPVDLDEILPASKQKKLVLPSINLGHDRSTRLSTDTREANGTVSQLKSGNNSSASLDSSGARKSKRRKEGAVEQKLDLSEAVRVGKTTGVRLQGMSDEELEKHVETLQELEGLAKLALEYWEKRRDGAVKEKEAFEGVIENLVKHARKVRK